VLNTVHSKHIMMIHELTFLRILDQPSPPVRPLFPSELCLRLLVKLMFRLQLPYVRLFWHFCWTLESEQIFKGFYP